MTGSWCPPHDLWHLDANGQNPRVVQEFDSGVVPRAFGRAGNRMLFVAGPQWQTMDLATERVDPMTWLQGRGLLEAPETAGGVTYIATYETHGVFLYRTDGTEAGTTLLRRFEGDFLDLPAGFTHFDGVTWFVAEDDAHGFELWRTDGTPEGTRLARDIVPGPASSFPGDLVATDDFLFFTAFDDEHGAEPWRITPAAKAPPAGEPPIAQLPLPDAPSSGTTRIERQTRTKATVTARVKRQRSVRGVTRWRVTGSVSAGACSGRVQVMLGRRERVLKRVTAPVRRCRFSAVIATRSRSSGHWLQAALADVKSRRIRIRA